MFAPLLLAVDFMNFTYTTNPCYSNVPVPAVMQKGSFSYFDAKMGAGFDLRVDAVKEGSLANGTRQAVVVIACDFPVGGTVGAYLYNEDGNSASLLGRVGTADWGPDWGCGSSCIHISFANKFLYVDQCKTPDCTLFELTTYALQAGKLKSVNVTTRQPPGN